MLKKHKIPLYVGTDKKNNNMETRTHAQAHCRSLKRRFANWPSLTCGLWGGTRRT